MNPSSSFIPSNSNKQQTRNKSNEWTGRRRWSWYHVWWLYEDGDMIMIWYHTISIMMVVVPPTNQSNQLTQQRLILKFMPFICWLPPGWPMLDRHILCPVKQQNTRHIKEIVLVACHNLQNTYVCIRHISLQTVPDYKRKSFFLSLSMRSTSRSGHFWKKK